MITDLLSNKKSKIENETQDTNDSQKAPAIMQAKVVENNDPEHIGYIKVTYTLMEDGEDACPLVRLLPAYGGSAYGNYIVPEIDDTVLVGFEGPSMQHPFLLGCLYEKDDTMDDESFNDNNWIKHFKTKGEVDIEINDEPGKQSITVKTPKGAFIKIEDENETCTIADEGEENKVFLDYKEGEITIEAKKKITFKTGGVELVMNGEENNFSLDASNDIEANGGNDVKVNAGTNLNLEGGADSLLQAGANVTVQGGAVATVTAPSVNVG